MSEPQKSCLQNGYGVGCFVAVGDYEDILLVCLCHKSTIEQNNSLEPPLQSLQFGFALVFCSLELSFFNGRSILLSLITVP